ncbi:hypothetical protein H0486_00820 [Lachnospiraceae bacterium MD1]|jgi:hypothetical protein|uniref:Uncharacterized protein n=1 Tax=Variimorphobacter saccharofermentans TaxID=2755051 RepID=A0A839JW33_9FIRM|nr:hypothetical protein [Variimorphobacter saccharofermentans]MBB2181438.1 hypothetical protein [Variimorphobacter saccharofermentans]
MASNSARRYDHLTSSIKSGNVIISGIMAIGIFSPIIIFLLIRFVDNQKKYIYSSMLILISLLSYIEFYTEYKVFVPAILKPSYSYYTLLASLLISVICILGNFVLNIKCKFRKSMKSKLS